MRNAATKLKLSGKKHVEMLEMKTSKNQIRLNVDNVIINQDKTEERKSEKKENIEQILHADNHKGKKVSG
jgi:hypothetical protein